MPTDFSKTQRIVLLVDLSPFLALRNPSPYLRAVNAVASRLLRFPPLSAALSAFKFFFSSLSPIRSAAVLPRQLPSSSISFNLPSETLDSLSNSLNSLSSVSEWTNSPCCPRAGYTARSLLQLIHDYAWEKENDDPSGEDEGDFAKISSNLVVLLSPIGQSVNSLVDYLEHRGFVEVFCGVRDVFVAKGIHVCWIDVKIDELNIEGVDEMKDEGRDVVSVDLKDGMRELGWGFCSSDLVILGSALLPLGLIYPKIGISFDLGQFSNLEKKQLRGGLSLEILDVNAKPLECKCCNLEFLSLQGLRSRSIKTYEILTPLVSTDSQSSDVQDSFWAHLGKGNIKLLVKSVHRTEQCVDIGGLRETVLVREYFQELKESKKKSGGKFFADSVLELVHREMGGVSPEDRMPIWQMFLSFLHIKGCCALVSFLGNNGDECMGFLKPLTTHLATIEILDAVCVSVGGKYGSKLPEINDDKTSNTCDRSMNDPNRCFGSQTDTSTSGNYEPHGDRKMRRSQRRLYQEMTWNSFCKAAFDGFNIDLFELYIVRYLDKSKRLKFLKCWMKQISNGSPSCLITLPGSKFEEITACDVTSSLPSPAKGSMPVSKPETSETFFSTLSQRIQQGLESGMDLQNLAERVVKSSIYWLCNNESNFNNQQKRGYSDGSTEAIGDKIVGILLRAPKDMKKIHQDYDPCLSSEQIVREYELQILLRMELMRADVSVVMGGSRKQKMLKQICSLLEIIQYLVAGGINGHVSLYDYVERTIKARYSDKLGDIVEKIYTKMDLLPFGDEDETPSILFHSEDSNQSWKEKCDKTERADASSINNSFSTEGGSSQPLANLCDSLQKIGEDEHAHTLNEARERRERARISAPFIGKARDLLRVWAPKQPKMMKGKHESLPKKSKRKDRQTSGYSVVCETPMTGNNRACSKTGESQNDPGKSTCSVSRALFQDN